MGTVAAKLPEDLDRTLRARAREEGKTPSEVLRNAVREYLAPPSVEWAKELQKLPRLAPRRRRTRPKGIDELTWDIDTLR